MSAALYFFAILGVVASAIGLRAFAKGFTSELGRRLAPFLGATPPPVARKPQPEVHPCSILHAYTPIDVQPVTLHELAHTTLLYRCQKCESHITVTYPGTWSIEAFLKRESDVAREIRTLEGLVR